MSLSYFEIERWDSVVVPVLGNISPKPMIYFKPTQNLIDFMGQCNGFMYIQIKDSGKVDYEIGKIKAIINPLDSGVSPRPVMQEYTGLYTLTLDTVWMGYPPNNGKVGIIDFVEILNPFALQDNSDGIVEDTIKEKYQELGCKNMDNIQIGIILTGILIVFLGILLVKN